MKQLSDLEHQLSMQKGFKLLQIDFEGGEKLPEATNGTAQCSHPYGMGHTAC